MQCAKVITEVALTDDIKGKGIFAGGITWLIEY